MTAQTNAILRDLAIWQGNVCAFQEEGNIFSIDSENDSYFCYHSELLSKYLILSYAKCLLFGMFCTGKLK